MANLDDIGNVSNPLFEMYQEVVHKYFGIGKVDGREITNDGIYYHVTFNVGNGARVPEKDLHKAPKVKHSKAVKR